MGITHLVIPESSLITLKETHSFEANVTNVAYEFNLDYTTQLVPEDNGGWVWWSLPLRTQDTNAKVSDVFESVLSQVSLIRSQNGIIRNNGPNWATDGYFSQWEGVWNGTRFTSSDMSDVILEENGSDVIKKMYKVYLSSTVNFSYPGLPFENPFSVEFTKGFNWTAYHSDVVKDIANSDFDGNDNITIIKSQDATVTLTNGIPGALLDLEPGLGYKIYCNQAVTITTGDTERVTHEIILTEEDVTTLAGGYTMETDDLADSLNFKLNGATLMSLVPPETHTVSPFVIDNSVKKIELSNEWAIVVPRMESSEQMLRLTYNNYVQMEITPLTSGDTSSSNMVTSVTNDIGTTTLGDHWAMNTESGLSFYWRPTNTDDFYKQLVLSA